MAERQGFEPWRRSPAYTLSRRAPSTTRPPLRCASLTGGARGDQADNRAIRPGSLIQMQIDAPGLAALLLNLAQTQPADLARAGDVSTAAGLQVDHI